MTSTYNERYNRILPVVQSRECLFRVFEDRRILVYRTTFHVTELVVSGNILNCLDEKHPLTPPLRLQHSIVAGYLIFFVL